MRETRDALLFPLASVCHAPPPVVDAMTVRDFIMLTEGLERAAQQES